MRDPEPQDLPFVQAIMLNMDPPQHREYRALVNKAFSPRMVNNLHGRIREMVKRIINGVIEKGDCDFVEEIAALLPMEVICEMMGVPRKIAAASTRSATAWSASTIPICSPTASRVQMNDAQAAAAEMFMYAGKLLEKARSHPGDDLATALVNAELDGQRLSDSDFNFFFLLLLIAGNETTRTVTTNGMLSLIENPDQLRDLRGDPSLAAEAPRGDPAVLPGGTRLPPHRHRRHRAARAEDPRERQGHAVVPVGES